MCRRTALIDLIVIIVLVRVIAVTVVSDFVITLAAVDAVGHQHWLLVEVLIFVDDDYLLILVTLELLILLLLVNLEVRIVKVLVSIVLLARLVIFAAAPILQEQVVVLPRHNVGVRHVRHVRRFFVGVGIASCLGRDWLLFDDNLASISLGFGCLVDMMVDDLYVAFGLRHKSIV